MKRGDEITVHVHGTMHKYRVSRVSIGEIAFEHLGNYREGVTGSSERRVAISDHGLAWFANMRSRKRIGIGNNLRVGRFIAVKIDSHVMKARILRGGGSVKIYYRLQASIIHREPFFSSFVNVSDEGLTWSRDWKGKAADALRCATALGLQT